MSSEFYKLDETKRFPMGPLEIDVPALYTRLPINKDADARFNNVPLFHDDFHRYLYGNRLIPLKYRARLRELLRKTGVDDLWLGHFQEYWTQLGGRPLWHPSDFFFLRNFYRLRQQPPSLNQITDNSSHLEAWQDSTYIYSLFHAVFKETFLSEPKYINAALRFCPNALTVLEYGGGLAPITTSCIEFNSLSKGTQYLIADLPTLTFHYGGRKFRKCSNVELCVLSPDHNFQLHTDYKFDIVFCCQVFEHLNEPLDTVKRLYQNLRSGGVLIFDYIKSEGRGLDSMQGLRDRNSVLGFVAKTFKIESGKIDPATHVGLTVARKLN